METHTVFNQSQPLVGYDMFSSDAVLTDLIARFGANWARQRLAEFGLFAGSAEAIELAVQANGNEPVLHTHDRFGNRIDEVEFHPAYHRLMSESMKYGLHNLPWCQPRPGAHVARAALMYMSFQNEAGHCCPISMTYSVVPALRRQPELAAIWEPMINSNVYDGRFQPAFSKTAITLGMGMTEKQGGSDVRANTTRALAIADADRAGSTRSRVTSGFALRLCPMLFLCSLRPARGSRASWCLDGSRMDPRTRYSFSG